MFKQRQIKIEQIPGCAVKRGQNKKRKHDRKVGREC